MKEHSEDEGATAPSLMFSRNAPIPVKNVLTRVIRRRDREYIERIMLLHVFSVSTKNESRHFVTFQGI